MADFTYTRLARNVVTPGSSGSTSAAIADDTSVDLGAPILLFDEVTLCKADAAATSNCAGLCIGAGENPAVPGAPVSIRYQFAGPLTLTVDQWANITSEVGGLTPHSTYYISPATAGKLTKTLPTNPNYIAPVGFALNATTLMIQIPGNPQQASP